MADSNIKQFRIPITDMPPIASVTEGYSIRYRVISEDRNRISHWSPVYLIVPDFTFIPGSIHFASGSQVATFTWDSVPILKQITEVQNINNKQLTSDIATLTTDEAHYLSVEDWVTISGVDSIFNGTYKISSITTNTFSYYKDNGNIVSTPVTPKGTYATNSLIRTATQYDVWVRWDRGGNNGDWLYKERISANTISLPQPSTYTVNGAVQSQPPNRVSIEVYLIGQPIERGNGVPLASGTPILKMYQLLNQTI